MKKPIKAARTLIDMSQKELSEKAGVPLISLRRLEGRPSHQGLVSHEVEAKVVAALEAQGIQFLEDGAVARGKGVALKDD